MGDETGTAYSADKMLDELEMDAAAMRAMYAILRTRFVEAIDPLIGMLLNDRSTAKGEAGFAVRHLLVRSVNDVVAAFHLACHGSVNQAYGAMRMAYEACDLIELIATNPAEGERWVNSDKPWSEFSPANVRDRLGKPRVDELYSELSAMAHPRFRAAQVTGYMRVGQSPESVPTAVLRLGPAMIDERPDVPICLALLNSTLGLVVLRSHHLIAAGAVTEATWDRAMDASAAGQHAFVQALALLLSSMGIDDAHEIARVYESRPRFSTDD